MTRPVSDGDWDRWGEAWRAERVAAEDIPLLIARTARARRALAGMRVLSLAITMLALAGVAAALYHAASVRELVLGFAVAIGICVAWMVDASNQRGIHAGAEAPPDEYLALRRALCVRRMRFARLVWLVAALDLVFLFPWWAGGMRYHGFGFRFVHLTSLWAPLALIIGTVTAAARIRSAAASELRSIEREEDDSGSAD
jgi:hypothetical protein